MVHVTSEIGRLRVALVHEPGPEVDRMVPAMMDELLFDDILYGDRARDEHGQFRRVLQLAGVEVLDASDLLEEALGQPGAREWVVDVLLEGLPRHRRDALRDLAPALLAECLVCGVRNDPGVSAVEAEELYGIPPLPNWCFQRDTQVILGGGVIFSAMAAMARQREALLSRAIFRHHPRLRGVPLWFDPLAGPVRPAGEPPHLEGGDVLILSEELLVVGLSERTNLGGVRALARALASAESGPRVMVVVELPRRRAYMHLDTLITQVDRNACLAYTPVIFPGGPEACSVWEIDLASPELPRRAASSLLDCLGAHGIELEPIRCGGSDLVTQQREQWTDGANALALAPGVITLFDRNLATADELARQGFRIVQARDLLLGREELDLDDGRRTCVLLASHEISRARGGPHCLVHPLRRD